MYFRKLTFILACFAAFVGFLIGFVGGANVSFSGGHETYAFWHNPYVIFYYPIIGALIAFFATFGVYYAYAMPKQNSFSQKARIKVAQ